MFVSGMLLFSVIPSYSQSHLNFIEKTTIVDPGSTKQLRAKLVNATADTQYYHISYQAGYFKTINSLPDSVVLAPDDSIFIPIILFVPRKAIASKPYYVTLRVVDSKGDMLESLCTISVKSEKKVYLTTLQPDVYLNPDQDTVSLQLQLHNAGNTEQQVKIVVNEQATNRRLIEKALAISGFVDTTLLLRTTLPSGVGNQGVSHMLVTGTYDSGDVFSTVQMNIFVTGSRKNYATNFPNEGGYNNMFAFYTRYIGTGMQYYELRGSGLFNVGPNRVQYQMNALYYPNVFATSLVLMNSYAKYLTDDWNVKAGNIYWNKEQLLNGRGVAFQLTPSKSTKWGIGYVNNNYNLAGKFNGDYFNSGNSVFTDYTTVFKNNISLEALLVQQWDPSYKGNSTLGGGKIGMNIFKHHRIQLGAYTSYHTGGNNKDSLGKFGTAVSVDYSGTAGKWQMQSSNYLSTKSYAGYQKGAINLMERVSYTADNNFNYWMQYRKNRNESVVYYPGQNLFNPTYSNEVAELGMNGYFFNKLSLTLRPYYSHENSKNSFINTAYNYSIKAAHLDVGLSYNMAHKQSFYLKTDAGWSSANKEFYKNYFAWKVVARYSIGSFSLNTSYQDNPYYSGELALYEYTGKKYALLNISPSFNGYLFNNKLMVNAGNSLGWERSYDRWTYNINLNLSLRLKHNFSLIFNFHRIDYFMFDRNFTAFDIGIKKGFFTHRQGKRFKLTLHLYEDENGNYQFDKEDSPAANQLVRIGEDLFRTNKEGEIEYKGIPGGDYQVSVLQSNGMIAIDTTISVHAKTDVYIPMHKIGKVSGSVKLQLQQFSFETDETVSGIKIIAIDQSGEHFEAITDAHGNFTLYLPFNTYTLQLDTKTLPEKYICKEPVKNIHVSDEKSEPVIFIVLVEKRKVEVRKFGASINN